jgi:hypothetical protein
MIFPFYEKALNLFKDTQKAQIIKGLKKYPEPFNPHSWSPQELLNHALEETVDLTHYLVGLKDLLDGKDKQIKELQSIIEQLSSESIPVTPQKEPIHPDTLLPGRVFEYKMDDNGNLTRKRPYTKDKYDINFNPHFDQDDQ